MLPASLNGHGTGDTCVPRSEAVPEASTGCCGISEQGFPAGVRELGEAGLEEDMAQDVFVRIWRALPGYRGQSSISTWIYAITRNACLTALRRAGMKREVSMEEPGVVRAAEEAGLAAGGGASGGIDVLRFLGQLPEKHQRVLRLYYLEEKSYEEVARLLEWPMGTVKVYLHRARKELAEAVARSKIERRTS
jgi:RNA polymerase sigma-70 factor (ECF subfamily)